MYPASRSGGNSYPSHGDYSKSTEKSKESRSGPEVKSQSADKGKKEKMEKMREKLAGSGEEFDYKPSEKSMEERKVAVRNNSPISNKAHEIVLKNESKGNTSSESSEELKEPIVASRRRSDFKVDKKEKKQANLKSLNNTNNVENDIGKFIEERKKDEL